MKKINICNVKIDNVSMSEAVKFIIQSALKRKKCFCATPNVDHIVRLQKDSEFRSIYSRVDLVVADGMPLLWSGLFLGTPFKEKVSGSDLFPKLCNAASKNDLKVFFMGGRKGAADKAKEEIEKLYSGIQIVGTFCQPFGFEKDDIENQKVIDSIIAAKPDVLFVGLGSPKQEKWIDVNYVKINVPVCVGIGVTFEFFAGMVKRAPFWMQKVGLEWFWRFLMEPRRLWKRYFIDDLVFFWLIFKQKMGLLK